MGSNWSIGLSISAYNKNTGVISTKVPQSNDSVSNDCMIVKRENDHAYIQVTVNGTYKRAYCDSSRSIAVDDSISVTNASSSSPVTIVDLNMYGTTISGFAMRLS